MYIFEFSSLAQPLNMKIYISVYIYHMSILSPFISIDRHVRRLVCIYLSPDHWFCIYGDMIRRHMYNMYIYLSIYPLPLYVKTCLYLYIYHEFMTFPSLYPQIRAVACVYIWVPITAFAYEELYVKTRLSLYIYHISIALPLLYPQIDTHGGLCVSI